MGSFVLSAQSGEQYRAETFCDTLAVSSSLPAVKEHACALQVVRRDQDIRYRILGELPQGVILVGHMRGICNILTPIDPQQSAGIIKTDSLQEGILHLLLVDNFGHPRTERLIYIHKPVCSTRESKGRSLAVPRRQTALRVLFGLCNRCPCRQSGLPRGEHPLLPPALFRPQRVHP